MGSTFVDFRGRGFEANDSTLEVWLALLVDEIDRLSPSADWPREVRDEVRPARYFVKLLDGTLGADEVALCAFRAVVVGGVAEKQGRS